MPETPTDSRDPAQVRMPIAEPLTWCGECWGTGQRPYGTCRTCAGDKFALAPAAVPEAA
jgi:DnaJ-class molecular chaperone